MSVIIAGHAIPPEIVTFILGLMVGALMGGGGYHGYRGYYRRRYYPRDRW